MLGASPLKSMCFKEEDRKTKEKHKDLYICTTPFCHCSLVCPKSPAFCLRGVNVSGCWIVIFECSLWDEFRVNICRIGTVSQSINQAVILSDRWLRKDPWYHVQKHSEFLFVRCRTKAKSNSIWWGGGGKNESKCIWPAAYWWQTPMFCVEICLHSYSGWNFYFFLNIKTHVHACNSLSVSTWVCE